MDKKQLPKAKEVLLLVDVINPLNFPGAEDLASPAIEAAKCIRKLKAQLRRQGIPTIYANDNYGVWQSDFKDLIRSCKKSPGPAAKLVTLLPPQRGDLTILKPRHSAFLGTPLDLMLDQMGVKTIILAGFATDSCIQLTAMDGFLRGYQIKVPSDCTAAESAQHKKQSLEHMQRILKCSIKPLSHG
ncbi:MULTISPECIES: cysteine hydrolase family protein [Polaromonas]|uniref:Cysteine hydrolase family protein n=1 Tax=Polaromonas aquatica TaxID=332657 RepID=A0ABW1U5H6_9BURK